MPIDPSKLTPAEQDVDFTVRRSVPEIKEAHLESGTRQVVAGIKYVFNYITHGEKIAKRIEIVDQSWLNARTIKYFHDRLDKWITLSFVIAPPIGPLLPPIHTKETEEAKGTGEPESINVDDLTPAQKRVDKSIRRVV